MRLSFTRSLAVAALALSAAPALAEEVTLRVAYDETDLTSDARFADLKDRIVDAADEACEPASAEWSRSLSRGSDCKATMIRKGLSAAEAARAAALAPQP